MRRSLVPVVLLGTLGACSDPSLSIDVAYELPTLRDHLASLTLSVVELPAGDDGAPVACDEVRYGRVSEDRLDGGRRSSASVGPGGGGLTGVPRLGDKLILLEGRDAAGRRIAGGCQELHDVDEDIRLTVTAEVAPLVRLLGQGGAVRDPSDPPDDFELGLFQPWREDDRAVGLAGRTIEIDVRDRLADRDRFTTATSCGTPEVPCSGPAVTGVASVPLGRLKADLQPPLAPGPVEVVVRAPWLEPLIGRAFEPLAVLPGSEEWLAPLGLQRTANQAAPWWSVVRESGSLRAAALYVSGGDARAYRIALFEARAGDPDIVRREILAGEPVFSLVAWHGEFWTRVASGWRKVNHGSATLAPGIGGAGEAATELFAIEPCDGTGPDGLLVRFSDGPYVAYDGPGVPHASTGPTDQLATLTALINTIDPGRILSTACLTYPTGLTRRTVVVRGEPRDVQPGDPRIGTFLIRPGTPPARAPSPVAAGFHGYDDGGDGSWRLAGAALDVTGPRLASYTLVGGDQLLGDDGRLDGELTTLPTSTAVADLDGDHELDLVVTAHEIVGETRLQATYLARDGRAPLTGLSPPFRGVSPLVLLHRTEATGVWLTTVATSDKLAVFDLGVR